MNNVPLVSVITVVLNNEANIQTTIDSVFTQNYPNIEHIVIDGGSTDNTVSILKKNLDKISIFVSEPDLGIYDALNKGIKCASGSVISILHSDDVFYDNFVVTDSIEEMNSTHSEFCFSDMVIIDKNYGRVSRYYFSKFFKKWMFRIGWMPPHPTCFINRALFDEFGYYSLNYDIAGDFDFLVRIFFKRNIRWVHLNRVTVKMRHGGKSNSGIASKKLIVKEINQSLRDNGVWSLSVFQLLRYPIRLLELILKPKGNHG